MSLIATSPATDPAAGHTYALPVVRELPRPAPGAPAGW
jgi:hypothetical protein